MSGIIKFPDLDEDEGSRVSASIMQLGPGRPNATVKSLKSNQKDASIPREGRASVNYYKLSPILNMVARKIGHLVAAQNWRLYVVRDPGVRRDLLVPDYDRRQLALSRHAGKRVENEAGTVVRVPPNLAVEEVFEHPLLDFLNSGSDPFTAYQIRQLSQVYYDILGECYLYIQRNNMGMPTAWHPINPLDIEQVPEPGYPWYLVRPSTGSGTEARKVPARDVFAIREPNPSDPYGRGLGLGQVLADELETHENATKYLAAFFRNSARPDILVTATDINPAAVRRLEARWLDRLRGVLKQFTPFFIDLPENAKVTVLDTAFQHGGVIELKEHERDVVLQTFGINPEIFGIIGDSNKATSEEAKYMTASTVIMPRQEIWRQALQTKIVPMFDDKLILDYDDPRPEQRERKIGAASKMPWAMSINEIRALVGEDPIDPKQGNLHPVTQGVFFVEDLSVVEDLGYQAKSTDAEFGTEGKKRRDRKQGDGDASDAKEDPPSSDEG